MTSLLQKRLERLQNRPTAYEIIVTCPETGRRYLLTDPITGKTGTGQKWQIRKSGRTQRQAFLEGELTWIVDA